MEAVTPRRIVASAIWHRGTVLPPAPARVRLDDLLVQAGQERTVRVAGYDVSAEATLHLLWCPPYSEENGWDDQPSEIELSQIVTGRVRRALPRTAGAEVTGRLSDTVDVQCAVTIKERISLLDYAEALSPVIDSAAVWTPTGMKYEHWRQVGWCGAADIGGFTYLSMLAGEANLELILKRYRNVLVVHYEQLWQDGAIGCWELRGAALEIVEQHLSDAVELSDRATPYLE